MTTVSRLRLRSMVVFVTAAAILIPISASIGAERSAAAPAADSTDEELDQAANAHFEFVCKKAGDETEDDGYGYVKRTKKWYREHEKIESVSIYEIKETDGEKLSVPQATRKELYGDPQFNPAARAQMCDDEEKSGEQTGSEKYLEKLRETEKKLQGAVKEKYSSEEDLEKAKKEKSEAFTALDEAEEAGKNGTDYWVK